MFFLTLAGGLTALTLFALLRPLLKQGVESSASSVAFDREVYKDQFDEITRDLDAGLIDQTEAEAAKLEISRRLLATDVDQVSASGGTAFALTKLVPAAFIFILISAGTYVFVGNPLIPDQPLALRQAEIENQIAAQSGNQMPEDLGEMVARAEAHLVQNPEDGRGWNVLAPIYFRMGDYIKAQTAYANAIKYEGSTAFRHSGLGETIINLNEGIVTFEARSNFERALELDSNDPRASFFLALGLAQDEETGAAIAAFEDFAKRSPADAPWIGAVRNQIATLKGVDPNSIELETATDIRAQTQDNQTTDQDLATDPDLAGPTQEQIEAVSQMSADDQMAMVQSMVSSLDERLTGDPQNFEGWQRLMQFYVVLNEPEKASNALARALVTFPADGNDGKMLIEYAQQLGIDVTQDILKQGVQ